MYLLEWAKIALKNIAANKIRSVLTTLGIIIGVSAVITLVSIGQGAARNVTARFEAMGSHLIMIRPQRMYGGELFIEDAKELEERVPSVEVAVPSTSFSATVKHGLKSYDTSAEGVSEGFPLVRDVKPQRGRFINPIEVNTRARVAVIGQTVLNEVFVSGEDPIGETLYVAGEPFTVIGVMEPRGSTMGMDSDDVVYIPITTAQRLTKSNRVGTIYVKTRSDWDPGIAVNHITAIYNKKFLRENAVRVTSQDELLAAVSETANTFTRMLAGIAGISLLVGGIGIMNIMLVSVTERTREIGIRKAIGARNADIMGQFLIESILLSVSGATLGIVLGIALSRFASRFGGWDTVISPGAVGLAFAFAAAVGLFFGVYPARKAAVMDPIEALRYE